MIVNKSININKDCGFIVFTKFASNKLIIVPNINEIAREMTTRSQMSLVIERVIKLGIFKTLLLIKNNILFIKDILNKDFAAGIKLLCELEILYSLKSQYLLHNQITDMAIALNNKKILNNYFYLSKKYKFKPGIITYNVGPLIKFLAKFKSIPEELVIYTPLERSNNLTNSGYEDIIDYIEKSHIVFKNVKV